MSEPSVTYSVREILARQDGKLDSILLALSSKADVEKVSEMEKRVSALEADRASRQTLSTWQRWFFGVLATGLLSALVSLLWVVSHPVAH